MSADRWAIAAVLLVLVGAAGPAVGQSLGEQAQRAEAKATQVAEDAHEDPPAAAGNATDPSWQGRQANWTQAWTCDTAHAVDEDAAEALDEAGDCSPGSARAGEEDQQANESEARAEEAQADAERAARDELAAAQAFWEATREEPDQAPQHAATFANRTLAIVERVVGGLVGVASLPVEGLSLAQEGLTTSARALAGAGQAAASGAGDAFLAVGELGQASLGGVADVGEAAGASVGEVAQASVDQLGEGLAALGEAFGEEPATDADPTSEAPAEPSAPVDEPELAEEIVPA
jgi:hypothetical protein